MDDGILEIRLVPAWSPSSVHAELKSALSRSQLMQAGIAYWTVNDNIFGPSLPRALGDDSGFLCVDLHPPTEIDSLAALVRKGAHVYLYCEDLTTFTDAGRKEPPSLLHAKMMFFWLKDRTVELWVGSHNWTNRAILGLNIESSIVVRARDSSILCADAAQYLQKVKRICDEFDLSKVELYKQAQRNITQRTIPVIELEASNAASLDDITVGLFGTDAEDLRELGTVRRDVYVSVFDSDSEEECLYPGSILQSGLLSASNPSAGGISFSRRRYAFRRGHRFPALLPEGEVGLDVLADAKYFVTLSLRCMDKSVTTERVRPKSPAWVEVSDEQSPLLQRLDQSARHFLFRGGDPQPKRPWFEVETSGFEGESSRALTLADRRSLTELRLVTRRILRRKG